MNENWKPGDLALGRIHDYEGLLVFRGEYDGWDEIGEGGTETGWDGYFIEDLRRLVVIDPEDREQVERLYALMWRPERGEVAPTSDDPIYAEDVRDLTAALREFANPTPPIEEPTGLGAVVEDADGYQWVYSGGPQPSGDRVWYSPNLNGTALYSEIAAVRVLSEGVTP